MIESILELLYLFISVLIAYTVKGIAGFGNTLIINPLFSFILPNSITTPVDLLFSLPINAYIVYLNRKHLSLKIILPLSIMFLFGDIVGALFLKTGNDRLLKTILSLIIVLIAIEIWTRPQYNESKKANPVLLTVIGIVSGILSGLYGISVLLVAYLSRTTNNKGIFRANLCAVFFLDNIFRFIIYNTSGGILTLEAYKLALLLSPAVIIGMFIGIKLDNKLNENTVKKFIILLMIVSGILLFMKNGLYYITNMF